MTAIPTLPPSDYGATDSSAPAPLWPTPRAYSYDESHTPGLTTLDIRVRGLYPDKKRYWPTPQAAEAAHPGRVKTKDGQQMHLSAAVREDAEPQEHAPVPSTSSTAGRPVNPLAQRVSALVQAIAGGAGPSSSVSLASYSPAGYWQRIQPALFPCDMQTGSRPLDEYSQSWPRWATVSATESGALLMSALRTVASACSSSGDEQTWAPSEWARPTPTVPGGGRAPKGGMSPTGMTPEGIKRQVDLGHHVRNVEQGLWATPTSQNAKHGAATPWESLHRPAHLHVQATAWPSPQARDWKSGTGEQPRPFPAPTLSCSAGGQLNPAWVSQLMGFPAGWLDIPGLPAQAKRSTRAKRPGLRRASLKE